MDDWFSCFIMVAVAFCLGFVVAIWLTQDRVVESGCGRYDQYGHFEWVDNG